MKKTSLFLVCLLTLAFVIPTQAQEVDEILDNYFENTGGIDNWKALTAMKQKGSILQGGMTIPFTVYNKAPNMYKIQADVQGKTLIPQAYDGKVAWSMNPFQMQTEPTKLPDEMAEEVIEEAELESPFINYKEKGHSVALEGKETIDGAECFKVKLTKKNGKVSYYFFDTENYVPIMIRSSIESGEAKGTVTETYMSEYQEAGDFMMPYSIVTKMQGQTVVEISIESIDINPEIMDNEFLFEKK